jgi:hypothetical protein
MKWWMVVAVLATFVGVANAADSEELLAIDLQLQNHSPVGADVLERSKVEVARIFAAAGRTVRWTESAPRYTVTIVTQALGYTRASSPVMGVALRVKSAPLARIFFRQVQDFAHEYRIDLSTILAYVIAHELGHLMLPGNAHSDTGVMQAEWDSALAHEASTGALAFTHWQAERIRVSR